jgi:heterotetrameric sarcosine oxidase gamma subunit
MRQGNGRVREALTATGPLDGLLEPVGPADSREAAELDMRERQGVVQLQLIARNGKAPQLAAGIMTLLGRSSTLAPLEGDEIEGLFVCATGPLEYWVLAEGRAAVDAVERIGRLCGDCSSLFDQTHGRFVARLSGARAQTLLSKGTALDLRPPYFPARGGSHTRIAQMPVLVIRRESAVYDISGASSYARSFVAWLKDAARGSWPADLTLPEDVGHSARRRMWP